jgi:hypothetical protein
MAGPDCRECLADTYYHRNAVSSKPQMKKRAHKGEGRGDGSMINGHDLGLKEFISSSQFATPSIHTVVERLGHELGIR